MIALGTAAVNTTNHIEGAVDFQLFQQSGSGAEVQIAVGKCAAGGRVDLHSYIDGIVDLYSSGVLNLKHGINGAAVMLGNVHLSADTLFVTGSGGISFYGRNGNRFLRSRNGNFRNGQFQFQNRVAGFAGFVRFQGADGQPGVIGGGGGEVEGACQRGDRFSGSEQSVQRALGTKVQIGVGGVNRQGRVQPFAYPNGGGGFDRKVCTGGIRTGSDGNQTVNRLLRLRGGIESKGRDLGVGDGIFIGIILGILFAVFTGGTLGRTLRASGRDTLGGTLRASGGGTFGRTLRASGRGTLGRTLRASGKGTLGGTLRASGRGTLGGTLRASGGRTLGGTLGLSGGGTLGRTLRASGGGTLGGTLRASGGGTFGRTLGLSGRGSLRSVLGRSSFICFFAALHGGRLPGHFRRRYRQQIGQQHGQCQEQGKKSCSDF